MPALQELAGKVDDAPVATGLDYFGARYFSGAQGRFTSPDPLLNSGRPWEPQSWNRYAYVLNNPLKYTDPTGVYDYAGCDAGKIQCQAWRRRIDAGVADARKALDSGNLTKAEAARLKKVLAYLGTAGDHNGVTIAIGSITGAARGQLTGENQIKLDVRKIDAEFLNPQMFKQGFDKTAEIGGTVVHEGSHGLDLATGVFDFRLRTDTREQINSTLAGFGASESRAYGNGGLVFKGLDIRSRDGLWNPSWAEADREVLRQAAMREGVERSLQPVRDAIQDATRHKK